jgi:O-succinylbenzoic acid--CoA ligase
MLNFITTSKPIKRTINDFLTHWESNDEFISLQTSGSTGVSKKIKALKVDLIKSANLTGKFLDLKEGNSALCCLPIQYISGKMMLIRTLALNLKLTIVEPSLNPLESINHKIDFCAMTPMQVEKSIDKLHLIKKIIIGGSPVSNQLKEKLKNFPNEIYETFAMTETYSHFALKNIKENNEYFKVLDEFKLSVDDRNCLGIETPFYQKFIQSNDIVKLIDEKTFIWKGRYDFIINSGGIKINPEEIEHKIKHLISNDFIISSIPDEILGQKLILVLQTEENLIIENLKNSLKQVLSKYEVPKEFYRIQQFEKLQQEKLRGKN